MIEIYSTKNLSKNFPANIKNCLNFRNLYHHGSLTWKTLNPHAVGIEIFNYTLSIRSLFLGSLQIFLTIRILLVKKDGIFRIFSQKFLFMTYV